VVPESEGVGGGGGEGVWVVLELVDDWRDFFAGADSLGWNWWLLIN